MTDRDLWAFVVLMVRVTGFMYLAIFAVWGARIAAGGFEAAKGSPWWDVALTFGAVIASEWRWHRYDGS